MLTWIFILGKTNSKGPCSFSLFPWIPWVFVISCKALGQSLKRWLYLLNTAVMWSESSPVSLLSGGWPRVFWDKTEIRSIWGNKEKLRGFLESFPILVTFQLFGDNTETCAKGHWGSHKHGRNIGWIICIFFVLCSCLFYWSGNFCFIKWP